METGDRELRKAFEETTIRNVKAILSHSNETRKLTKELESKVDQLNEQIRIQNTTIEELRNLLVTIQAKIYIGGS